VHVFYDTKGRRRKTRDIYKKVVCLVPYHQPVSSIYATNNDTLWEELSRVYCSVPIDDRDKRESRDNLQ
jgi:hypothetical protein